MLGFEFLNVVRDLALKYPQVRFTTVDSMLDDIPSNVQCIVFREEEGGYIAGIIAGLITRTRHVGVISGVPYNNLQSFLNGYVLGVLQVCQDCKIEAQYIWSFDWKVLGTTAARYQIDSGIDVLFGAAGAAGSEAIMYAAQHGAWVIGVDSDEWISTFDSGSINGSDRLVASTLKNMDISTYMVMFSLITDRFRGGQVWIFDYTNQGIGISDCHEACGVWTDEIKTQVARIEDSLADRTGQVPILRESGHVDLRTVHHFLNLQQNAHRINTWIRADLMRGRVAPVPRTASGFAVFQGMEGYLSFMSIHVFGGWSSEHGELSDLWMYDLGGHIWMQKRLGNNLVGATTQPSADLLSAWGMHFQDIGWLEGGWPAARSSHSLVLLQPGYLLVFGGQKTNEGMRSISKFKDLWMYVPENLGFSALAQWFLLPTSSRWSVSARKWVSITSPAARSGHSAHVISHIVASTLMKISRQNDNSENMNPDFINYVKGGTLSNMTTSVMVLFGGRSDFHFENDLWLYWHWPQQTHFNLTHPLHTWSRVIILGEQPSPRERQMSAMKDMVLFIGGGRNSLNSLLNDFWMIDLAPILRNSKGDALVNTLVWEKLPNLPFYRDWSKMVSIKIPMQFGEWTQGSQGDQRKEDALVVVGGQDSQDQFSDVWVFLFESNTWKRVEIENNALSPRSGHLMVAVSDRIYVGFGQTGSSTNNNDLWWLDLEWRFRGIVCNPGFELVGSGTTAVCLPCSEGTYNLVSGGTCLPCPVGALCMGKYVTSQVGYWQSMDNKFYRCKFPNMCCPLGNCTRDSLNRCGLNRKPSSVLCGECIEGFSDWTGQCVSCSKVDWGLLTLLSFIGFAIIIVLISKKPDNSAFFKLFVDYGQLVVVVLPPTSDVSQMLK